jgi:hypothetical protein
MSIDKTIPTYSGTVPDKDAQTPSEFNDAADEYVNWYSDQPDHINEWANQANSTADAVNTDKNAAEIARTGAETAETNAETARDYANDWATGAEDTQVDDGVNPAGYSAYHWAQKSAKGERLTATSSSSVTVGTGSKTFTLAESYRAFTTGSKVRAVDGANPVANYMEGTVTSYDDSTDELVVDVVNVGGSGTIGNWYIGLDHGGDASTLNGQTGFPNLTTLSATSVTGSGATLRCSVDAFGMIDKDALEIAFDWKEDGATSWNRTSSQAVNSLTTVTQSISGLSVTTTYLFRPVALDALNPSVEVAGDEASFATPDAYIETPTITNPSDGATDIGETPTFTTDSFTCVNGSDTHASTSWWLYDNTTDTLVWSSVGDAINLTSIDLPAENVETSTEYRLEVLHTGETYGDSAVTSTTYTTSDAFEGVIGVPGTQGFGVGIYPGTLPSGFSELTGTTDETNDNYGNYEYSDGSICVFIPKFYYRINNSNNPTYANYSPNDIDIKGMNDFADETEANAAGYALHRAFIDGGSVKPGFFIDKYMASKHGTADAALSAANGVPLSLTNDTSYTNTASLTGCSGILADAVVLSRARGSGWNAPSVFMYSALRMLSLAHAQAATGTTYCAWYDSGDTTNYPKGCNNALGDVDDGEVSYTTAGDSGDANKPLTGSGTPFAKTTHNGQACGVADLNGGMREACLGMTQIGTSATDTGTESDESIYLLKEATALADLTSGWDGSISANDAWGNVTHLENLYDQVTSPHDLGTNTGTVYWGNGSNQVLSAATSGVDRDFCGVVPMDDSASSASGTNLFGVDWFYRYNRHNMVPLACGSWSYGAVAGVWFLDCYYYRSDSYDYSGFRAAAYGS